MLPFSGRGALLSVIESYTGLDTPLTSSRPSVDSEVGKTLSSEAVGLDTVGDDRRLRQLTPTS